MQIQSVSREIITQLIDLSKSLTSEQYAKPLDILLTNSIGKHVRHIIEFYDILRNCKAKNALLCYDSREHCEKTEKDPKIAIERLKTIQSWFFDLKTDHPLQLQVSYDKKKKNGLAFLLAWKESWYIILNMQFTIWQ